MKGILKSVLHFLVTAMVTTALLIGFQVVTNDMWLFGLPELDQVESVSIAYPQVTDQVKTVTGEEDKELALNSPAFSNTICSRKPRTVSSLLLPSPITCRTAPTGGIAANGTTVWWKDKAYPLKDPDTFVNLTEGIFFLAEVQAR